MTATDGRVTRGQRNREAIIDGLLACYEAGALRPSVPEVAARAGVSVRSVHNHFADVEALHAEVARRQVERYAPLIGPAATIEDFVDQRAVGVRGDHAGPAGRVDRDPRLTHHRAQPRARRARIAPARRGHLPGALARVASTRSSWSPAGTRGTDCGTRRTAPRRRRAPSSSTSFARSSKEAGNSDGPQDPLHHH